VLPGTAFQCPTAPVGTVGRDLSGPATGRGLDYLIQSLASPGRWLEVCISDRDPKVPRQVRLAVVRTTGALLPPSAPRLKRPRTYAVRTAVTLLKPVRHAGEVPQRANTTCTRAAPRTRPVGRTSLYAGSLLQASARSTADRLRCLSVLGTTHLAAGGGIATRRYSPLTVQVLRPGSEPGPVHKPVVKAMPHR